MQWLLWTGVALCVVGLAALLWCVGWVIRARAAGLDDSELRHRLRRAVAINLAAMLTSIMGLMAIVVALLLGPA